MDEFKYKDRIKIVSSDSSQPENLFLDGMVGIYLRKANDEESVVRLKYEEYDIFITMTVNNKYIRLLDKEDESMMKDLEKEETMNDNPTESIHEEHKDKENFIPKLQEFLGIADGVRFYINSDLLYKCYFENGKLILTEKNSDKVIEDDNLRNKVFYGLATGTIKPIVGKLITIPKDGFKYYYWDSTFDRCQEKEKFHDHVTIQWDYWEGSIKDYMCFYVGNCFPTKESCEKNYNVIEQIKNQALQTRMDKLIIGPGKIAIPFYGTCKHKTIRLDKPVGVYVLNCGKDEYGGF